MLRLHSKYRGLATYLTGSVVTLAAAAAVNLVLASVTPAALAEQAAVATWTATPVAELQVGARVEGQATPTPASDTEARLWRIIEDLEGRLLAAQQRNLVLEEEMAAAQAAQDVVEAFEGQAQDVVVGSETAQVRPWESVHVRPDLGEGSVCTPPNRGIVLCGVPEGAAYAVYDARGNRYPGALGTVPSAGEMAEHLGRDAGPVELWRHGNYSIHYHPEAQEIAVFHGVVCIWARNRLGKVRHGL